PEWGRSAEYAGEFPFGVVAGGEQMTVTAITDGATDAFARTVASGWGTADSGQSWSTAGGSSSDYAVGSGVGTHTLASTNVSRRSLMTQPYAAWDLVVDVATSATAAGGFLSGGLVARVVDANNLYQARLELSTPKTIILTLRERVGGTETALGSYTLPLTHVAGTLYRLRFQGQGSALRARAWLASGQDPYGWHVTATDTDLTAAGSMGVRSISASANTNTNPVVRYDNFRLLNPQVFTVTRAENGVEKSQSAGTAIQLATPPTVAL